jgi:uncharacterized protein (DUF1697 family)
MPRFVALLRGVNVGKAKRVPMAQLRAWLAELGYSGVATLLNSGNAVFQSSEKSPAKHAADIAATIAARLKMDVRVIVKSANELESIVADSPLTPAAEEHSRLLVAFVQDPKSLSSLAVIEALSCLPNGSSSARMLPISCAPPAYSGARRARRCSAGQVEQPLQETGQPC